MGELLTVNSSLTFRARKKAQQVKSFATKPYNLSSTLGANTEDGENWLPSVVLTTRAIGHGVCTYTKQIDLKVTRHSLWLVCRMRDHEDTLQIHMNLFLSPRISLSDRDISLAFCAKVERGWESLNYCSPADH